MALNTTMPDDIKSTDQLKDLPDDLLSVPPAYLSFGQSPEPMVDPPNIGEYKTYVVRVQCVGDSESVRDDGEHRYGRKLKIAYVINPGDPTPPDQSADQPGLFDHGDEDGEPEALGDVVMSVVPDIKVPKFSNLTGSDE